MISKEEHYEQLLGLSGVWKVSAVTLDLEAKKVEVEIGYDLSQSMELIFIHIFPSYFG